ncbi:FAD-binding protein [Aquipuribacter sp. SD81]|uniref:FAD-binding protein n=1 Tax=Aquipuribacter sp. SD81 TaxID=3127703 RepID=UPI0030164265
MQQTAVPAARNWAGNITFSAREVARPTTVEELRDVVAGADRLRVLGSGHSFSTVADTDGVHVVLDAMPPEVEVDTASGVVRVAAGLRYGDVVERLHAAGRALPTTGSLPHICIAGAAATGTHGSGDGNGTLARSVVAVELLTPDGASRRLARGDEDFDGAVVALGSLGVVTSLELETVPAYDMVQTVHEGLSLDALDGSDGSGDEGRVLAEVMAAGRSVSVFTTWGPDRTASVWCKQDVGSRPLPTGWLGTRAADGPRHPVPGQPVEHCTEQLGVPGPWYARLPHFRLEHTPSAGDELQSEWLVPRAAGPAALRAVGALAERVREVLLVSEIRSIGADTLWLSMAEGRDSLALHFTWVGDTGRVRPVVAALDEALAPFGARPHWGKVFTAAPEQVAALYPRMADLRRLRAELDPRGVMGNAFTEAYLG